MRTSSSESSWGEAGIVGLARGVGTRLVFELLVVIVVDSISEGPIQRGRDGVNKVLLGTYLRFVPGWPVRGVGSGSPPLLLVGPKIEGLTVSRKVNVSK